MPLMLVLAYHLLLLVALAVVSGAFSAAEIALVVGLLGLGGAALVEAELMIEPRGRRT
jgi:hypothetical protein